MDWKCAQGHRFKITADHVINGNNWCPICAGNAPLSYKDAVVAAARHNGKCLSSPLNFTNSMCRLIWQCADGHEWSATLNNVRNGRWCPHCTDSIGESLTRQVLEHIFEVPFKKGRYGWLPSPETGNPMELDGFNETLKIAFEYQGPHHYDPDNSYIKNREHLFKKVRAHDAEKARICCERKIKLILIYKFDPFQKDEKIALIVYEAVRLAFPKLWYNPSTFRSTAVRKSRLAHFAEEANRRGGELLSSKYKGMNGKLTWRCANGHVWDAVPSAVITRGTWCARCKRGRKTKIL